MKVLRRGEGGRVGGEGGAGVVFCCFLIVVVVVGGFFSGGGGGGGRNFSYTFSHQRRIGNVTMTVTRCRITTETMLLS